MNPIALKISFCAVQVAGVSIMVLLACYFLLKSLDAVLRLVHVHAIVCDWVWHRESFKRFMASKDGARFRFDEEHAESTPEAARKRLERGDE